MTAAPAAAPALAQAALIVAKSTLLLGAAAASAQALRRGSAAARHLVWTLALGGLLALPALVFLLPDWKPALLAFLRPSVVVGIGTGDAVAAAAPAPSLVPLLLALWAVGALVVLGRLAMGLRGVSRLARSAEPVTDPAWTELLERFAAAVGVRRPVVLLRSREAAMPLTWGAFRPAVLLPAEADGWSTERRRVVLLHELAHVARRDCLMQLLAELCCALYWFHPGAWWAARQMRIEREQACDDLVLAAGARASDYAGHLLDVARAYRAPSLAATVAMARPSHLEGRVRAVLEARRDRRVVTGRTVAVCAGAVLLASLPLAAVAPSERAADEIPAPRVMAWRMPAARTPAAPPVAQRTSGPRPSIRGWVERIPAPRPAAAPARTAEPAPAPAVVAPARGEVARARTPEPGRRAPAVRLAASDGAVVATLEGNRLHAEVNVPADVEVRVEGHGVRAATSRGRLRIDADIGALAAALSQKATCPKTRAAQQGREVKRIAEIERRAERKGDLALRILGDVNGEIAAGSGADEAEPAGADDPGGGA